jgi:transposase
MEQDYGGQVPCIEPQPDLEKPLSMRKVAEKFKVSHSALQRCTCFDKSKHLPLGSHVGRASLLSEEEASEFLCQVPIRADCANEV